VTVQERPELEEARTAEAVELMERAYDLLQRHNAPEALKVGKLLEQRRYSGGFEIQARALRALGRWDEAIAVLEAGVQAVPGNFLLWQYLGSCRSDAGDYEGAFAAYDRAKQCEHDPVSLGYNHAQALSRAGRWDEAEQRLEPLLAAETPFVVEPELGLRLINLCEAILRRKGCHAEADQLVEKYASVIARASAGKRL
jgi:tetratricopeptide (TPR) repeat protein